MAHFLIDLSLSTDYSLTLKQKLFNAIIISGGKNDERAVENIMQDILQYQLKVKYLTLENTRITLHKLPSTVLNLIIRDSEVDLAPSCISQLCSLKIDGVFLPNLTIPDSNRIRKLVLQHPDFKQDQFCISRLTDIEKFVVNEQVIIG